MRAVLALSRAELRMLVRNRTAAFNAVLIPLGLAAVWIATRPPDDAAAFGALLQVAVLAAMTVAATSVLVLVARRNRQVLQRWQASGAAPGAILVGTLAPVCVLFIGQAAIVLAAIAIATGSVPAQPLLLTAAVVLAGALAAGMAFVTAAFTRTVDSANITSFPILALLFGGAVWTASADPGEATWGMLATGGGAAAELVRLGWDGLPDGDLLTAIPAAAVLVALTTVAALAAARTFRWSPRV